MKNKSILLISVFIFCISSEILFAQYDKVSVTNPVYSFLERAEAKGFLPNKSLALKPLMRYEIIEALKLIRKNENELSEFDLQILKKFEKYFEIIDEEKLVLFYSPHDSSQVFSKRIFDDNPKYVYHYDDSEHNLYIAPLIILEDILKVQNNSTDNVFYGNIGLRTFGTLGNLLGYNLQFTNGLVLTGNREILKLDKNISGNLKFMELNSDFDFVESGVNLKYKWLNISIAKEARQWGSGVMSSFYLSDDAQPFTAINIGVNFNIFSYLYTHGSLISYYPDSVRTGFNAVVPDRNLTMHRLSIKPEWGEFAVWEGIVYSKRGIDVNYLNPLSFYKSLEHYLRDRDNSLLGFDFTVRPVKNIELKGTFILDDIIYRRIGKNYWSNKTAWNAGILYSPKLPIDLGFEYSRIEPYTFSHFDILNNYTNDRHLLNSGMQPNSDQFAGIIRFWWGEKIPLKFKVAYIRHGENIYDENGKLIRNVGGDFNNARYINDSEFVYFLDGIRNDVIACEFNIGYEIFRDCYLKGTYNYYKSQLQPEYHLLRLSINYENF